MTWDPKNALSPDQSHLLNQEEIAQGVLNKTQDAIRVESLPPATATVGSAAAIAAVDAAHDRAEAFTYLDEGTADERLETVVRSSASLGLSYTITYTYAGSAGNYRLAGTARS